MIERKERNEMKKSYEQLIKEMSDRDLMLSFVFTQILLIGISIILGAILFDHFSSFLSLFHWKDVRILTYGGLAGIFVVVVDCILMKLFPSYYDDGGLNEKFFSKKPIWQILIITAIVAIVEEILFRGVIQTHFGLVIASTIFIFVHYRYLFHWFLFLNITFLSFFIGFLYSITGNLLVTIFMHFLIDFLEGLFLKFVKVKNQM